MTGLGDARYAVVISPQYQDLANGAMDGRVVLVSASGALRQVRTQGMHTAKLAWTDAGLAFSDQGRDVVLGDSPAATPRTERRLAQTALTELGEGWFLSLFNVGFVEGGYANAVTVFNGRTSASIDLAGLVDVVATCGQILYLVTHEPSATRTASGFPYTLTAVTGAQGRPQARIVAHTDADFQFAVGHGHAVCLGGDVAFLHAQEGNLAPDDGRPPSGDPGLVPRQVYLTRWSISDGALSTRPLSDERGKPLAIGADALFRAQYAGETVTGRTLTWVSGDGVAGRTDLETLRTKVVAEGLPTGAPIASVYHFTNEDAWVLAPLGDPGRQVELVRYRLRDCSEVSRLPIPGLAGLQSPTMIIRDLAVRPRTP